MTTETATDPALLRFRGVSRSFDDKSVLRSLDLDVREGEVLSILGPSGCGKSVLLKLSIGLLPVDGGEVLYRGEHVETMRLPALMALRQRVGMVFQGSALFDSMSVADNLRYGLAARPPPALGADELRARVAWALGQVGLEGIEDQMPAELSGGMRKRVGIARTIILRPELVLYDEPTAGLDPINCARIGTLIAQLRIDLQNTALVVTHDLPLAFAISDRIALLDEGKVALLGPASALRESTAPAVRAFLDAHIEPPREPSSHPSERSV